MNELLRLFERQREFQREVGFPIDSISEVDRNDMSEKYVFKLIEEAVELRKEFPSVMNPWSKKQKAADIQRVKEEFSDVMLFLMNIALVWRFTPTDILEMVTKVQNNNFDGLKRKKMDFLNSDILKIPGRISGIGSGNLSPKYVFIGQNPSQGITQGYKFWSNKEDGSSKVLLPILEELGVSGQCYFTNIVKCTTPNNLEPSEDMTKFYMEFLLKELSILSTDNPQMKVIVMGKWAHSVMDKTFTPFIINGIPHPASILYGGDIEEYKNKIKEILQ